MRREGFHERESFAGKNLRQATLDGHRYKMCDFSGADLRGASLRGASFSFCDLRGADLRGADLTDATFGRVLTHDPAGGRSDVTGARFEDATVRRTFEAVIGWPGRIAALAFCKALRGSPELCG